MTSNHTAESIIDIVADFNTVNATMDIDVSLAGE